MIPSALITGSNDAQQGRIRLFHRTFRSEPSGNGEDLRRAGRRRRSSNFARFTVYCFVAKVAVSYYSSCVRHDFGQTLPNAVHPCAPCISGNARLTPMNASEAPIVALDLSGLTDIGLVRRTIFVLITARVPQARSS